MTQPRCPFCQRPVGRLWVRCRVCGTRLAPWFVRAFLAVLAALSLLALLLFRELFETLPF